MLSNNPPLTDILSTTMVSIIQPPPTVSSAGPIYKAKETFSSSNPQPDNFYQLFKISQQFCQKLTVTVMKARGLKRGKVKEWSKQL